ncbi:MAG: NADP-dependent oxidoreductase [Fibrobacter sp.]|nr:NADP-dependent oxidoreductase [Fibrobacter sp.]
MNPIDWKIRNGYLNPALPIVLGGDFSGIVVGVGASVTSFVPGDEVYGSAFMLKNGSGSFAEYCVTDISNIAIKPKNADHLEAAALPLAGVSALEALTETMHISKGFKLLIHGGAGGIGHYAIQIAKNLGATVATTINSKDTDFVRDLGATVVIDYKKEKFEERISRYDGVLDTVGGDVYKRSFSVLRKGAVIVSMVAKPDENLMQQYDVRSVLQFTQITSERLQKLSALVDRNIIRIHIDKVYPLNQVDEALSYLQNGSPEGKVVIKIR